MNRWISFVFIFILLIPVRIYADSNQVMRVHFIDVGQGDSMLIETPENRHILIDGGEPEAGPLLVKYLKKANVDEIDLLVATHPDMDHIGGLIDVMRNFPVKRLIDNGRPHRTKLYAAYRMQILKETIPVKTARENEKIELEDGLEIQVLNANENKNNNNQSSIVLKLSYGEVDFLLMSDAEAEQEKAIAKKYDIRSEIVKIAHHGSNSSSSLKFLKAAAPETAIITYRKGNDYGHPVNRVIKNLRKIDAHIYSTAVYGNILIETDGENYVVLPDYGPLDGLVR